MAYTPGVGRVSQALADHPEDVPRLTIKGNSVAVVTDGSAVLGLGNIGPMAALPVMEGKAALFKRFADIDAWPICLDTTDVDEIVRTVQLIAPGFGGINLEDIAAPRCFEIEAKLRERLSIPVFHDDQHGTAIVVLAALKNALRCIDMSLPDAKIIVSGGGAAGSAIVQCCSRPAPIDVTVSDRPGLLNQADESLTPAWRLARREDQPARTHRHPARRPPGRRRLHRCQRTARPARPSGSTRWPTSASSSHSPTPTPRSTSTRRPSARPSWRRVAVDYPNQINNVLAFPGVFRGLLDARATDVTTEMLIKAADASPRSSPTSQLNPNYIIPSVFHPDMSKTVAKAIVDCVPKKSTAPVPKNGAPLTAPGRRRPHTAEVIG